MLYFVFTSTAIISDQNEYRRQECVGDNAISPYGNFVGLLFTNCLFCTVFEVHMLCTHAQQTEYLFLATSVPASDHRKKCRALASKFLVKLNFTNSKYNNMVYHVRAALFGSLCSNIPGTFFNTRHQVKKNCNRNRQGQPSDLTVNCSTSLHSTCMLTQFIALFKQRQRTIPLCLFLICPSISNFAINRGLLSYVLFFILKQTITMVLESTY